MDLKLFEYVLNTQGIWAILFVFTFLFMIRANAKREKEKEKELKEFRTQITQDLKLIHANMTFIVSTVKIILEKELQRRNKK